MNDFQDTVPLTKSAVIQNLTFKSALYGFDFPLVYETLTVQLGTVGYYSHSKLRSRLQRRLTIGAAGYSPDSKSSL
jgi:hypothetical protein